MRKKKEGKQGNILFLSQGIQGHGVTEYAEQEPDRNPFHWLSAQPLSTWLSILL